MLAQPWLLEYLGTVYFLSLCLSPFLTPAIKLAEILIKTISNSKIWATCLSFSFETWHIFTGSLERISSECLAPSRIPGKDRQTHVSLPVWLSGWALHGRGTQPPADLSCCVGHYVRSIGLCLNTNLHFQPLNGKWGLYGVDHVKIILKAICWEDKRKVERGR